MSHLTGFLGEQRENVGNMMKHQTNPFFGRPRSLAPGAHSQSSWRQFPNPTGREIGSLPTSATASLASDGQQAKSSVELGGEIGELSRYLGESPSGSGETWAAKKKSDLWTFKADGHGIIERPLWRKGDGQKQKVGFLDAAPNSCSLDLERVQG